MMAGSDGDGTAAAAAAAAAATNGGGGGCAGQAEIDTSAPFRSVKEAVVLYGERVLAGEICAAAKLHHDATTRNDIILSKLDGISTELEETRHSLKAAKEESLMMANYLASLQEELASTKMELQQLKERELKRANAGWESEDLKFVEDEANIEIELPTRNGGSVFQRNRCVKFASPPELARAFAPEPVRLLHRQSSAQPFERQSSLRTETPFVKKKNKNKSALIPLIGGFFSKKKSCQEGASSKSTGP